MYFIIVVNKLNISINGKMVKDNRNHKSIQRYMNHDGLLFVCSNVSAYGWAFFNKPRFPTCHCLTRVVPKSQAQGSLDDLKKRFAKSFLEEIHV